MKDKKVQLPPRIWVWCDVEQAPSFARLHGGKYFCAVCGATDHDHQNDDGTFTERS